MRPKQSTKQGSLRNEYAWPRPTAICQLELSGWSRLVWYLNITFEILAQIKLIMSWDHLRKSHRYCFPSRGGRSYLIWVHNLSFFPYLGQFLTNFQISFFLWKEYENYHLARKWVFNCTPPSTALVINSVSMSSWYKIIEKLEEVTCFRKLLATHSE